ncbi:hypothetical protein [Zoogloea ramigera]|jgi:hypothetical protein|uniref:hypothetical protein n=1 Tax=Zoogloea ramigera TaxID=350 RepID=UPI001FE8F2E9|nr:hypothetical protein [Zoogloea ramigera]
MVLDIQPQANSFVFRISGQGVELRAKQSAPRAPRFSADNEQQLTARKDQSPGKLCSVIPRIQNHAAAKRAS